MAVCITTSNLARAIAALGSMAFCGTAIADPLDDVMGGLMRDARSSFARMVPIDLVPTMPSLQPPPIQPPAATQSATPVKPQAVVKPIRPRPPLSPAAAALAAAEAAENTADANLDAALATNEKALSERDAAKALAKADPSPANVAAAKAAVEAALTAEANLTDALLTDKDTDARLKAARAAVAAEQTGRRSSTRPQAPMPVSLTDK